MPNNYLQNTFGILCRSMGGIPLHLFHICIVFPLFMYLSVYRGFVPLWIYQSVVILGILLLLYHAYLVITKWKAHSPSVWVNVIHVLFIAPLLIYIGKNAHDTPSYAFELLAILAFSALGYNLYQIVLVVQNLKSSDPRTHSSPSPFLTSLTDKSSVGKQLTE